MLNVEPDRKTCFKASNCVVASVFDLLKFDHYKHVAIIICKEW